MWSQSVFSSTNHSVYHSVSPSAGPKPTTSGDAMVSWSPVNTHSTHSCLRSLQANVNMRRHAPQQQQDLLTYFLHLDSDCFGAMMCFQQKKNGKKPKTKLKSCHQLAHSVMHMLTLTFPTMVETGAGVHQLKAADWSTRRERQ